MTAIAEQMQRQGLHPRDVKFDIAIAKYFNSGGDYYGAFRRLEVAAARMSGEGQFFNADHSLDLVAQARQQVEGEGPVASSDNSAEPRMPAPSFNRGACDQTRRAAGLMPIVALAREPSPQQRAASAAAANVMAITIMDTLKIDGRSIGNWTIGEARKAGRLKSREGYILIEAARVVANANGSELIRHVVKPKELQKIIQKAAEVADAV